MSKTILCDLCGGLANEYQDPKKIGEGILVGHVYKMIISLTDPLDICTGCEKSLSDALQSHVNQLSRTQPALREV